MSRREQADARSTTGRQTVGSEIQESGQARSRRRALLIGERVARLPIAAAIGFGVILASTVALGIATQRRLQSLERHHYPALEQGRQLRDAFLETQRVLYSAVVENNSLRIAAADSLRGVLIDLLTQRLDGESTLPPAASALRDAFTTYYVSARSATVATLTHPTDDGEAIGEMMRRRDDFRRALDSRLASDRTNVAKAFEAAVSYQRIMWVGITVTALTALILIALLAASTVRRIVAPLHAAVDVAGRLADGDTTVQFPTSEPDEVGALLAALQRMVHYLHEMSGVAASIAQGDVSITPTPRSSRDRFGTAFADMVAYLQDRAAIAERLARGDLAVVVEPRSPRDAFGRSLGLTLQQLSGTIQELRVSELRLTVAERETRARESRFRALLLHSSDVVWVVGTETEIQYVSEAVTPHYGYAVEALLGESLLNLVHPDDTAGLLQHFAEMRHNPGASVRLCHRLRHEDGTWRQVESLGTNHLAQPAIGGVVLNMRDVGERTALEAQLAHQAFHDALTGLANRTLFHDRVEHALVRAQRSHGGVTAMFIDLDEFKDVNDSLGHGAGDQLLTTIAARLLDATRGSDTVARLGGDEFAVLLENLRDEDEVLVVVNRVQQAIRRPVALGATTVTVGASIGVASARSGDGVEELLRNADVAMYEAKRCGKGQFTVFEPSMYEALRDRILLEAELRQALERDEFLLLYQPIVELEHASIVGVEALVRWQHPDRGVLAPATFIPVAEEIGLIVPLGRWVLQQACRQAAAWLQESGRAVDETFYVSVNLSARQLLDPGLTTDVAKALADAHLSPARLLLEITESVIMRDHELTIAALQSLKSLGVRLAIDDFGTGYSSLSYLQRFPLDIIKIDRLFVQDVAHGRQDAAVVRTIVALGESLGLSTIAEGVETPAQQERLRTIGCETAQGYLFSHPVSPEQIGDLLSQGEATRVAASLARGGG